MKKTYELCICLLVQKIYTNIEIKLKHGEEMHKISVAPSSSVTSVQADKVGTKHLKYYQEPLCHCLPWWTPITHSWQTIKVIGKTSSFTSVPDHSAGKQLSSLQPLLHFEKKCIYTFYILQKKEERTIIQM